ncbi:MAG TPA: DUF503 domain-containing protein [Thermomicrobiales bacterium]|nr:DUF503 domain-containing protein [Thermomicrobiales bacterium]
MSATIGKAAVSLYFEATFSLKDKRGEMRRISRRIQNRFNVAIAEIADLDDMRVGTLGLVVVSTSATHADQMLETIIAAIEDLLDISTIGDIETELIPF